MSAILLWPASHRTDVLLDLRLYECPVYTQCRLQEGVTSRLPFESKGFGQLPRVRCLQRPKSLWNSKQCVDIHSRPTAHQLQDVYFSCCTHHPTVYPRRFQIDCQQYRSHQVCLRGDFIQTFHLSLQSHRRRSSKP